jgi:hypothetical protein
MYALSSGYADRYPRAAQQEKSSCCPETAKLYLSKLVGIAEGQPARHHDLRSGSVLDSI